MSESSGGRESLWQCRHCRVECMVPLGAVVKFCPLCQRAPEQELDFDAVYCVHPDCRIKLFTPSQQFCHKCGLPQAQQQPKPPSAQAASVSTGGPALSDTSQVQHYEAVEKAVEAQRSIIQHENSQSANVITQTTFPQHMPPTPYVQQVAGSSQGQMPAAPQTATGQQGYYIHYVRLPQHSQTVYQGMSTQQPQTGGPTLYPRVFGPPQASLPEGMPRPPSGIQSHSHTPANQPHTGSPQASLPEGKPGPSSGSQSHSHTPANQPHTGGPQASLPEGMPRRPLSGSHDQVPGSQHPPQSSFQGSQGSSSSPESTGGPPPKVLKSHPGPPTATPQVPPNNTQPPLPNQPLLSTDIPPTSESIGSTTSQFTAPPTASTASTAGDFSMSASNKGLSNENRGQPHQVSNNTNPDGTRDREKQMGKEEEGKGDVSVSKPKEATEKSEKTRQDKEKGQGADQDESQLKLAISDPLQSHSADSHTTEHASTSNKRKRSNEETADASGLLSKQQKGNSPNAGATDDKGASPSVSDQQQKKDGTQPQNLPSYATVAASGQVCP